MLFGLALAAFASGVTLGPPDALKSSDLRRLGWMACVLEVSGKYAALAESPETIAESALGQCSAFEAEYQRSLDNLVIENEVKLSGDTKTKIVANLRNQYRSNAITNVLELRLKSKDVSN